MNTLALATTNLPFSNEPSYQHSTAKLSIIQEELNALIESDTTATATVIKTTEQGLHFCIESIYGYRDFIPKTHLSKDYQEGDRLEVLAGYCSEKLRFYDARYFEPVYQWASDKMLLKAEVLGVTSSGKSLLVKFERRYSGLLYNRYLKAGSVIEDYEKGDSLEISVRTINKHGIIFVEEYKDRAQENAKQYVVASHNKGQAYEAVVVDVLPNTLGVNVEVLGTHLLGYMYISSLPYGCTLEDYMPGRSLRVCLDPIQESDFGLRFIPEDAYPMRERAWDSLEAMSKLPLKDRPLISTRVLNSIDGKNLLCYSDLGLEMIVDASMLPLPIEAYAPGSEVQIVLRHYTKRYKYPIVCTPEYRQRILQSSPELEALIEARGATTARIITLFTLPSKKYFANVELIEFDNTIAVMYLEPSRSYTVGECVEVLIKSKRSRDTLMVREKKCLTMGELQELQQQGDSFEVEVVDIAIDQNIVYCATNLGNKILLRPVGFAMGKTIDCYRQGQKLNVSILSVQDRADGGVSISVTEQTEAERLELIQNAYTNGLPIKGIITGGTERGGLFVKFGSNLCGFISVDNLPLDREWSMYSQIEVYITKIDFDKDKGWRCNLVAADWYRHVRAAIKNKNPYRVEVLGHSYSSLKVNYDLGDGVKRRGLISCHSLCSEKSIHREYAVGQSFDAVFRGYQLSRHQHIARLQDAEL